MENIDLAKTGSILLKYHNQTLHIIPIRPYTVRGVTRTSNIRIFPRGGGIRSKPKFHPKAPLLLRKTDSDGSPTTYDERVVTTCIELEPYRDA